MTVKVLPAPASLCTAIVPPIRSTIWRVKARPSPVPGSRRTSGRWLRKKRVNSWACSSALKP